MATKQPSHQSSSPVKPGLVMFACGIAVALVGAAGFFLLLSQGFSGGSLSENLHLSFNAVLLIILLPLAGVCAALAGLGLIVAGLLRQR